MATADEVAALRLLIAEPDETYYTEEQLSGRLDDALSANHAAHSIWVEKAARYTELVDKSEGGSSRSNGALQDKALKMVELFKNLIGDANVTVPVDPTASGYTVISRLWRS
jgi:hypothetical protein